jgi:hypothetical protein
MTLRVEEDGIGAEGREEGVDVAGPEGGRDRLVATSYLSPPVVTGLQGRRHRQSVASAVPGGGTYRAAEAEPLARRRVSAAATDDLTDVAGHL